MRINAKIEVGYFMDQSLLITYVMLVEIALGRKAFPEQIRLSAAALAMTVPFTAFISGSFNY